MLVCQAPEPERSKKTGTVAFSNELDAAIRADAEHVLLNLRQTREHFGQLAHIRQLALERSLRFFSFLDASEDLGAWLEERCEVSPILNLNYMYMLTITYNSHELLLVRVVSF